MKTTATLVQVGGERSGKWLTADKTIRVIATPATVGFTYVAVRISDDSDVATAGSLAEMARKLSK